MQEHQRGSVHAGLLVTAALGDGSPSEVAQSNYANFLVISLLCKLRWVFPGSGGWGVGWSDVFFTKIEL